MKPKVLIIEDEDLVREGIELLLDINGYQTSSAPNGLKGIELALAIQPDLIICDIMMPGANGYQVLESVRANQTTAITPFLFLTAKADHSDIRAGMNLGADDYLLKPFDVDDLLRAVASRLQKKKAESELSEKKLKALRTNLSFSLPHEFLTPLNGILGCARLLKDGMDHIDSTEKQELLDEIMISGERLHQVILKFLLFSRLELLAYDLQAREELKQGITHSVLDVASSSALSKANLYKRMDDLTLEIQDQELHIRGDYLSRALDELLDNAFKFSSAGSPVSVKGRSSDNSYIITVQDRGRGMTAEQIDAIGGYMQFDRDIHEQQGTGLGLAIASHIAHLHGGNFTIASTANTGTIITFTLPLHANMCSI
jgi:signal transduction histidine kinase